jgi:hypothetical protein
MSTKLVEYQHTTETPTAESLNPLKYGRSVALRVTDDKMVKKTRIGLHPVLFIIPTSIIGVGNDSLIFALQGYGCEVMRKNDIKPLHLNRIGLSMKASKVLADELNKLFSV